MNHIDNLGEIVKAKGTASVNVSKEELNWCVQRNVKEGRVAGEREYWKFRSDGRATSPGAFWFWTFHEKCRKEGSETSIRSLQ